MKHTTLTSAATSVGHFCAWIRTEISIDFFYHIDHIICQNILSAYNKWKFPWRIRSAPPPNRTQFFRFIHFSRKALPSDVDAPSPMGNPGSAPELSLADPGVPPSNRIQFFRFRIRFRWKAPVSEVGAPSPEREILDPPLTVFGTSAANSFLYQLHV